MTSTETKPVTYTEEYPKAVLVIEEPTEYLDRNFPTASWWERWMLTPGTYPLVYTSIEGHPVDPSVTRPYYVRVRVPGVKVESHFVNRLLHHTSTQHTHHVEPEAGEVCSSFYAYRIDALHGGPSIASFLGGRVEVRR